MAKETPPTTRITNGMSNIRGRDTIHRGSMERRIEVKSYESQDEEDSLLNAESADNASDSEDRNEASGENPRVAPLQHSPEPQTSENKEAVGFRIPALVVFALAGMMIFKFMPLGTSDCSFRELKTRHPKQNHEIWSSLSIGIENILKKNTDKPAVYLFLHKEGTNVKSLLKEMVETSCACFGEKANPIELKKEDFLDENSITDYGYIIDKYKKNLGKSHVVLVAHLNELPPITARALHTICDTHSPITKDVVIFLSLETNLTDGNAATRAKTTLHNLWNQAIAYHELEPLITRVTDDVLELY